MVLLLTTAKEEFLEGDQLEKSISSLGYTRIAIHLEPLFFFIHLRESLLFKVRLLVTCSDSSMAPV